MLPQDAGVVRFPENIGVRWSMSLSL
jgi:hypothetical protein